MNVAFIFTFFYFDIVDENLQTFIVMIIVTEPGCLINAFNENFTLSFVHSLHSSTTISFFSYVHRPFSLVFSHSLPFSTSRFARAHSTSNYLTSTPLLAKSLFKVYAKSNIKQNKKWLFWLWKMKINRTNSWNKFQLQLFWELMNNAIAAAAAATPKRGIFL